jgi:aryl-alcohol dehydrogenase-like predicted oxidoreductase
LGAASRLALGTVQFGLEYGVANQAGQVSLEEAERILESAHAAGIDTLDTAPGYGDSESRLGEIGVHGWRIISKIPEIPDGIDDVAGWVEASVTESLSRLGVDHLAGLLLHRPRQLNGPYGDDLRRALDQVRVLGLAQKVGVSVYGPSDLDVVWSDQLDLVQAPFNVFDRSLASSRWLERFAADGVEVHTRSAFLQGLLLMKERPRYFDRWSDLFVRWDEWLAETSLDPVAACIGASLSEPSIGRAVVGVESVAQLQDILVAVEQPIPSPPDTLRIDDPDLIDPSQWSLA